ncbi:uncharacterized protein [Medicago truncatula]|uniref:uncharacterized protein isoform X2 n=1 Tax=Medicago truncatula TaxID=3880 RepID=UPI00196891A4|nr:uncharacterized protein LOC120580808 isoform X2 [Medicago truncatula]
MKKQSEKNTENRKKLKVPHAGGSRSNARRGRLMEKISKSLSEDKERTVTIGVSSKINAYTDDAIGKLYGAEHSGRVCGLGLGVCPTIAFGKRRHFTDFIQAGSSNEKNVEDLQKQVESLGEKLIGYEKTKEQLTQAIEKLTKTTEQLTQPVNLNKHNIIWQLWKSSCNINLVMSCLCSSIMFLHLSFHLSMLHSSFSQVQYNLFFEVK